MARSGTPLVEMRSICKRFDGVQAVDDVTVDLYPGEVVGVLGHNGAGKSTLLKMLAGAYPADSGEIYINGAKVEIGRAHVRTPVTTAHLVCRLLLDENRHIIVRTLLYFY